MSKYTKLNVVSNVLLNKVHYLTSDYRARNPKRPTHKGMDMIGKGYATDYIVAIDKGIVESAGNDSSRGYYVRIKHNNGLVSVYYHMKAGSILVKKGQLVPKNGKIGIMGNTGNSSGAHLHFGIYKGDTAIDPKPYLLGEKNFSANKINIEYQVYDNRLKKWLGVITNYNNTNSNGYAGYTGHSIGGIRAKLSNGEVITLKSHVKGQKWLSPITKWDDTSNGYSGIKGKAIDGVQASSKNCTIVYRVHVIGKGWLNWIRKADSTSMGYAGIYGKEIDKIQMYVE